MMALPPRSSLFPYTTLFRSQETTLTLARQLSHVGDALLRYRAGRYALGLRSEEHTSELQSRLHLVCRLLLEKKKLSSKRTMTTRPSKHPHTKTTVQPIRHGD